MAPTSEVTTLGGRREVRRRALPAPPPRAGRTRTPEFTVRATVARLCDSRRGLAHIAE